jgi:hypothetical protein
MTKTNPALPPSIEDELKCPVCRARLSREDDEHPCDPDREQRESAIRAEAIAEFVLLLGTEFEKRAMFFCYRDAKESLQAVADEMMETKR